MNRCIVVVWFENRRYEVHLPSEVVYGQVFRRHSWERRRVTSRRIETACVLRASDQIHGVVPGRVE